MAQCAQQDHQHQYGQILYGATASLIPPAGTTTAVISMAVTSLNATIYVDACTFQRSNLITNSGFERDADGNGLPDTWTTNSALTRSTEATYDDPGETLLMAGDERLFS